MKTKRFFLCFISCLFASMGMFAKSEVNVDKVVTSLTLSEAVDYHITASAECIAAEATIDLTNADAWLFFDNIAPNDVKTKWLSKVKVNGASITPQQTAWVSIYKHGTVVIPHAKSFAPLTIYTGEAYGGDANSYAPGKYASLGKFDNSIKSFKLKRGYMVTMAQSKDGSGYSRCFIAQDEDIEIPNLLDKNSCTRGGALYNKVSFIRVMRMQMPSKKGCLNSGDGSLVDATWYYNYDVGTSNTDNMDFAPMFHHVGWNSFAGAGNASETSGVIHTLGFNEPWNYADSHSQDKEPGVEKFDRNNPLVAVGGLRSPLDYQREAVKTGHRIGSMAPTDGNLNQLFAFVKECDRLGLRLDYVAVHIYVGGLSAQGWYDRLKWIHDQTGRPLWITEFNNGANWTSEGWPSTLSEQWAKQKRELGAICAKMNEAPFVERYAIYNNVERKRYVFDRDNNNALTPAGEDYKAMKPGLAYNKNYEVIPIYPSFTKPTIELKTGLLMSLGRVTINVKDDNGEYLDKIVVEKKLGNGQYEVVKESTTSINNWNDNWDREHPQKTT